MNDVEANTHSVIVRGHPGVLTQTARTDSHQLVSDEPLSLGGLDIGPTPYDLLLASLGACTAITLRMYATRKGWPLEDVEVSLSHDRIHAEDCADCEAETGMVDRIDRDIRIIGDLDREQRQRLLQIADACPVHKTLSNEIHIVTRGLDTDQLAQVNPEPRSPAQPGLRE